MQFTSFLINFIFFIAFNSYFAIQNISYMKKNYRYSLLRENQRSQNRIIALENFDTLYECKELAIKHKGLAFNFGPKTRSGTNFYEHINGNSTLTYINNLHQTNRKHSPLFNQPEEFFNCLILNCPETINFTNVIKDSRFDYYSLYSNPPPPTNSTCIPEIGIFLMYTKHLNYSDAFKTCKLQANGSLAYVISDARTNALSNLLVAFAESNSSNDLNIYSRKNIKYAYVGLNFTRKLSQQFLTPYNESLSCFLFRAWAPGHPILRHKSSCVAITQDNSWITTNCKKKLSFFCEIYTS